MQKINNTADKNLASRIEVWHMFDRIAKRYDLLNRLLSFGLDVSWRKKVANHLPAKERQRVVDLATGTCDLILSIFKKNRSINSAVGIDMAIKMLKIGKKKLMKKGYEGNISLGLGDAAIIPVKSHIVDAVTIGFGIRNVVDVEAVLKEIHRILTNNGRIIVLEFSLPKSFMMRKLFLFYLSNILPAVGSIISGDKYAYRYLNQTVEEFPYGREFCKMIEKAGFSNVYEKPLTFGISTIYCGEKLI